MIEIESGNDITNSKLRHDHANKPENKLMRTIIMGLNYNKHRKKPENDLSTNLFFSIPSTSFEKNNSDDLTLLEGPPSSNYYPLLNKNYD